MPRRLPPAIAISAGNAHASREALFGWLEAMADAGIEAVQLREKRLDDLDLYAAARRAREILPAETLLLVNGRADVALAAGADGVHLTSRALPVAAVRGGLGEGFLIGVSTHRLEEIVAAREGGADYATYGPVHDTPGKGPARGLEALARACATGLPIYALGGVTISRLEAIAEAGAAGVAAIRSFQDPERAARLTAAARDVFRRRSGARPTRR